MKEISEINDAVGRRFERLVVLAYAGLDKHKHKYNHAWVLCDCGNVKTIRWHAIKRGYNKACGCLRAHVKHGHSPSGKPSAEYRAYMSMLARASAKRGRCADSAMNARYRDRGISVCERWEESFANFLSDMGPRPSPKHSLDRIDNNGPYSPDNCRWATRAQQLRNTRRTLLVTFNNETLCAKDWAQKIGISYSTLLGRLRSQWPVADALTMPVKLGLPKKYRTAAP